MEQMDTRVRDLQDDMGPEALGQQGVARELHGVVQVLPGVPALAGRDMTVAL